MIKKKIFISYSWTTPAHEEWVINLAQRLVSDGIEVVLDKWDLKPGHDKFAFMEQMVHSEDVDKVLIILDNKYAQKANDRSGGVGTETVIISPEVYKSTLQTKFIPVVSELDDNGNAPLPTYLAGKIFIDLSALERFEEGYELLLRDIYQRPATARPKLGIPPSYLFEDSPVTGKTNILLRGFESKVDRHPNRINSITTDFLDSFIENLKEFKVSFSGGKYSDLGKLLMDALTQYIPLRNDYISFLQKLIKTGEIYEVSLFSGFFEKLNDILLMDDKSVSSHENDHFKFIRHELFLYSIAIALKKEHYILLDELLNADYFLQDRYQRSNNPSKFDAFRHHSEALEQYQTQINNQRYFSVTAHLLIQHLSSELTKEDFTRADLLCYYASKMRNGNWFPLTYIYQDEYSVFFPFFSKMVSKRHLEKVIGIFGISDSLELIRKFSEIDNVEERGYSGSFRSVQKISHWVKIDEIGSGR